MGAMVRGIRHITAPHQPSQESGIAHLSGLLTIFDHGQFQLGNFLPGS